MSYKNSRHEWTFQTVILVDDETNKSYYIANGLLDRVNPNYTFVHKEIELSITDNTIIKESDHVVSTHNFSEGFVSLEHTEKLPNGAIFDLLCMLVTVNPIIVKGDSKRREIVVTNELMERTTVTLWGDFAVHDGAFVEKLKNDQPVPGLCDVRVSKYRGTFGISTIPVSSVLINPVFPKAQDLHTWYTS
ncbi:hypothetical protein KY290_010487 [Solanum tuberosum]|uniref:Replication protein A OB domain-containing protein n=1 Tax=Solanum tuberosum TaxID=4113 RepID=A0ABQ7VXY4_SOLTU|nr:hypothetical protein KY290_010487 [Solanum tuberosum]